jgi:hypothetical protein
MERAMGMQMFARMRRSLAEAELRLGAMGGGEMATEYPNYLQGIVDLLEASLGELPPVGRRYLRLPLWQWCWSYQDELRFARVSQLLIDSARRASAVVRRAEGKGGPATLAGEDAVADAGRLARALRPPVRSYDRLRFLFSQGLVEALRQAPEKALSADAWSELAATAIALRRHQLRYRRTPHALADLAPEFLPRPPIDPATGQSLRYRLDSQGRPLLYSVGADRIDNGGDPRPPEDRASSRNHTAGRDWVWPSPATPEEIAAAAARARSTPGRAAP